MIERDTKYGIRAHACGLAILAVLGAACIDEPAVERRAQEVTSSNGVQVNAMSFNAMTYNAMTHNAMTYNALGDGALVASGFDLEDPESRLVAEYIVSCALPAGEVVTVEQEGVIIELPGGLGLAPEWADGPCDQSCQEWVSACLLARVNARGERVEISLRGDHRALRPGAGEVSEFSAEEGAYFGNLFDADEGRFACSARADLALPRSCGASIEDCYVDVLGHCDDVCLGGSTARGRSECEEARAWPGAITVYVR